MGPPVRKYSAFISYRHADNKEMGRKWASWLHETLEAYEVPKDLVGKINESLEPVPPSLYPVFRDEQELRATPHLRDDVFHALENAGLLVVICSPRVLESAYVADEIRYFKELGKEDRILTLIVDGDPNSSNAPFNCYPEPLRLGARDVNGKIDWTAKCSLPLSADVRPEGKPEQGWTTSAAYREHLEQHKSLSESQINIAVTDYADRIEQAKMKIVAGALAWPLGELTKRDKAHQLAKAREHAKTVHRWLAVVAGLGIAAMIAAFVAVEARQATATQLRETTRQLERSQLEEGRAWLERARTALEKKNPFHAAMFAGRSLGFSGYGREQASTDLKDKFPLLLGGEMRADAEVEEARKKERSQAESFVEGVSPSLLPIWSSPVNAQHHGHVGCVAFSPDGKRIASATGVPTGLYTIKLWETVTGRETLRLSSHTEGINSLAFSPDGRQLASGSDDTTVKLWDATTGEELASFTGHTDPVNGVAFSPDGKLLASGSWDRSVKLWDVTAGKELASFNGHTAPVNDVAFSPDGKRLVSGSSDNSAKLWDAITGKELGSFNGHTSSVTGVAFDPDGKLVISGSWDNSVKMWDVTTGKELVSFTGHTESVNSVSVSSDGRQIISGSGDNTVKIWEMESGKLLHTLLGHGSAVSSVAFSSDGSRALSGSYDGTVRIWRTTDGSQIGRLTGHSAGASSVVFSPNGLQLASGSKDKTVSLWNIATGELLASFTGHKGSVNSVAFSPDGTRVASGSEDHTIRLWGIVTGKETACLEGHSEPVRSIAFSPDGLRLASASGPAFSEYVSEDKKRDNTVKLWDVATGKEMASFVGHKESVGCVTFSPDGLRLASGSKDGTVKLWDAANGDVLATFNGPNEITTVAFSPDGKRVAAGLGNRGDNYLVKIWALASGQETVKLVGHTGFLTSVAFSPDGKQIISGAQYDTVKLWDAATGTELATLVQDNGVVESVAFSPDGSRIASASEDGTVKLWDVGRANDLGSLTGHVHDTQSKEFDPARKRFSAIGLMLPRVPSCRVAFSPDGMRVATASWDSTIKLWDTTTGKELAILVGHTDGVESVSFNPDGTKIVSGSEDKTVMLWDGMTGKPLATLTGHTKAVTSVAFSPDGRRVASGSHDQIVILWDVLTYKEAARCVGHADSVESVAFSPVGTQLASASWDRSVKLWSAVTGKETATFTGHKFWVTCVAFNFDGTQLASGSGDNTVRLWDTATGKNLTSFNGHADNVTSVAFSPNGKCVASGSEDRTVKLWEASTGKELTAFSGPFGKVSGVSFSPDGVILASGWSAVDGSVVLFGSSSPRTANLVQLQEAGLFRLEGREIVWGENPSLLSSLTVPVQHYRADELCALAVSDLAPSRRAQLQMQLCAKAGQFRSAMAQWQSLLADPATAPSASSEIRRLYLIALIDATRRGDVLGHITTCETATLIPPVLTKEMLAQPTISLAMMSLMQSLAKDDSPEMGGHRKVLEHRLEVVAPKEWLQVCRNFFSK